MKKATLLLISIFSIVQAQLDMTSDQMDFEDNIAQESQSNEHIFTNSIVAKPILNDGKPFYVARDPTTGTLDFNIKKTVGIQNDIPVTRKDELSGNSKSGHDINSLGHNNFHDYLNLPVKYSSSKFVYPLISGSYANLKYQGNNKNQVSNHKDYSTTVVTSTPKYFTHITNHVNNIFTSFKHPDTTNGQVVRITTRRPTTTTSTTTETPTTTTTTERISTTQSTTESPPSSPVTTQATSSIKYSSTIVQNSFPSTFKNKYVDSSETRKKTTMATTTTKAAESSALPPNPIKFLDDLLETVEKKETKATTYRPQTDRNQLSFSTSMPLLPSAFKPMPTEAQKNKSQSHKIVFETGSKNPSIMTLSEIINSFTGNDNSPNEQYQETSDVIQSQATNPPPSTNSPQNENLRQTLQQQLQKNQQQNNQPQNNPQQNNQQQVNSPVHQQTNFAPPSHVDFPNEEFEDYVEFENPEDQYANQYVKYEVQKPNVNLVKFQQIPSMNNVVISPGQNSASFVLGSQQSVGSVGIGSSLGASHFNENIGPMKVGQVINDEPPVRSQPNQNSNQIQSSIRFPSDSEQSFDNAQIVKGTIKMDGPSENVQPPQALSRDQMPAERPLVFPSNEHNLGPDVMNAELSYGKPAPNPSQIIFENVNDIYEKINDKKQKQGIASNDLSNKIPAGDLTPPRVLTPPSPTQNRPFNKQPQFNVRRPVQQRIPGLPNILPQFRPNAKASQGHQIIYKDVGAIRIPMQGPNPFNRQYASPVSLPKVGLPPMLPPHSQNPNFRRVQNRPHNSRNNGPNHPPQHPSFDQINDSGNRRVFRVPQQQMNDRPQQQRHQHQQMNERPQHLQLIDRSQVQLNDQVYMKPPPISPPGFQLRRPQNGAPETMQMQQRPSNIPQSPDAELNKSSPPPPVQQYAPQIIENYNESNSTNLEPVITLQMLQHKKSGNQLNLPPVPHDIPQDIQASFPSNHKEEKPKTPSIYVVYPVTSNSHEQSEPLTSHSNVDDQPINGQGDYQNHGVPEYQNTPFSVVSHFEQEPLLMKKDKRKNQFPYHLERPASNDFKFERPKYGQAYDGAIYNLGEQPTSRVVNKRPSDAAISSTLTRVTEKPIAIAYTPTEPNRNYPTVTNFYEHVHPSHQYSHHYDPHLTGDKFSVPNYGGPVISEILDDKHIGYDYFHQQQQLQQHLNNGEDLDFYKEHYDFQAPFQASVSVNPEVTNPYEGWSIVTQSTDTNKIDRADLHLLDSSEETTTRKFDPNEFQPVFESGFQPIYSGSKVSTAPELILESSENPTTHALNYSTQPIVVSTPSSSSYSSSLSTSEETSQEPKSSEETTTHKIEKKKEIDSLEAFFESLTRDYDDEESENKSENESKNRRSL